MPPHHVTRWSDVTFEYIASKYELNIETIYHEKLQDIHKRWYLHTLVFRSLCSYFKSLCSYKLISTSIFTRIVSKFSSLLSRLLVRGLEKEMLPNGHTVLVVFRKK